MVESSKILTVSYGTFSCTLEGFEDSFSTMKAIAEYFRDLAAGDRYFGAEPPTPDAEMLARIAEREISRRVEMRTSETGIVLRASDPLPQTQVQRQSDAPAMPAAVAAGLSVLQPRTPASAEDADDAADEPKADAPAADVAEAEAADATPVMPPAPRRPAAAEARRDQSRAEAEDADVTQEAPAPARPKAEAPAHPDADSVAAKLQRIRAVVGGVTPAPAAATAFAEDLEEAAPLAPTVSVSDAAPEVTEDPEPTADATPAAEVATAAAPESDPAEEAMAQQDKAAAEAEADARQDGAETDAPEEPASSDATSAQPDTALPETAMSDAETDAAIARAMAVFGGADTAATPSTDAAIAVAANDESDAEREDAGTAATVDEDDTDDQISAVLRNLQRAGLRSAQRDDPAPEDEAPAQTDAQDTARAEATPPVQPSPRGRILRVTRRPRPGEQAEAPGDAARDVPTPAPVADAAASGPASAAPQVADVAESDAAIRTTSSVAAMIAAAQRAKRAAAATEDAPEATPATPMNDAPMPEAIVPSDDDTMAESDADDATDATTVSVAALDGAEDLTEFDARDPASSLSEEDEADLQRTLAALKAEVEEEAHPAPAAAPAQRAEVVQKPRRDELPDTSEAEMSRIMSQANEELADPESSRRRNAIAHLKAAVAATEAARQLGETGGQAAATEDAFREDLEQVVRPRRAARPEVPAERSDRPRPAPLKLVASQRIDLEAAATAAPVQPRRVASDTNKADDAGNFAEFAESMGATSLQDLLEAAAAYTAYVEGSEDFSRPHIMQKVRQTVTEDFSREDGLRSFGTLLRQGRIERSRNGRFTVTEGNRFKPESMAAGG